jgi:hypothetical protein
MHPLGHLWNYPANIQPFDISIAMYWRTCHPSDRIVILLSTTYSLPYYRLAIISSQSTPPSRTGIIQKKECTQKVEKRLLAFKNRKKWHNHKTHQLLTHNTRRLELRRQPDFPWSTKEPMSSIKLQLHTWLFRIFNDEFHRKVFSLKYMIERCQQCRLLDAIARGARKRIRTGPPGKINNRCLSFREYRAVLHFSRCDYVEKYFSVIRKDKQILFNTSFNPINLV